MLHADIGHWRELGYGPWAMVETGERRFVGRAGLHRTTVEGAPATELAWTTDPACQGRGLRDRGGAGGDRAGPRRRGWPRWWR